MVRMYTRICGWLRHGARLVQLLCLRLFLMLQGWGARLPRREAQTGQSMVEYALLAALIAVVVLVAVQLLGTTIAGVFQRIAGKLAGVG